MSLNIDIRKEDKLDEQKLLALISNWTQPETVELELPIQQRLILYLLKEIESLKLRIQELESKSLESTK